MNVQNRTDRTMKAVFVEKPGGPLITKEVPIPVPGPSEVLVKITAAPINPSDLAGIKNAEAELETFIPGLEGSGVVVEAGKGLLPKLWLGKRVACSAHYSHSGTWAEYMVTSAGMCFPLSEKVSDEQGSMSLVNPLTAIAFLDIVEKENHKALINNAAASALGRMVELLAVKQNIPVINLVRSTTQLETLKKKGSQYVLNTSEPSFIDNLKILSADLQASILFDSVCSNQLLKMVEALPKDGSVIIYGNLTGESEIFINPRSLIANNIKVRGFLLGNSAKENCMLSNMLNLIKVRRLMTNGMTVNIRERYSLNRVQEAVDSYLSNMSAGKVILKP
jgi:NADPH:quinone reductase